MPIKRERPELEVDRIGSQTERLTAEEETALAEFFKNLKLKYQMEMESEKRGSSSNM